MVYHSVFSYTTFLFYSPASRLLIQLLLPSLYVCVDCSSSLLSVLNQLYAHRSHAISLPQVASLVGRTSNGAHSIWPQILYPYQRDVSHFRWKHTRLNGILLPCTPPPSPTHISPSLTPCYPFVRRCGKGSIYRRRRDRPLSWLTPHPQNGGKTLSK